MVCVISLNIRGLRNRKKRYVLFKSLRDLKSDIVCIQESYITTECAYKWEKEWGGRLFYCEGTPHSKGNVILIRKGFETKDLQVCFQNERVLGVSFNYLEECYKIFCVYAPNDSKNKILFFNSLKEIVSNIDDNVNVFIGGDFNCALKDIDNITGKRHDKTEVNAFMNMCNNDLSDCWRLFHVDEKDYTWKHKSKNIMRRLDYFFGNKNAFRKVVTCEHIDVGNTDHRGLICNFALDEIEWGKSYWKMNNSFLKEKKYVDHVNKIIDNTSREFSDDLNNQELWDYCKVKVKQYSISYGKNKAFKRKSELDNIRNNVKVLTGNLVEEPTNDKLKAQLTKAQIELGVIENVSAEGARIRSKVNWIQNGEKSTKYFLNLEKHRGKQRGMIRLKKENGEIVTEQQEIMNEQVKFYRNLYKKKTNFDKQKLHEFLNDVNIPKLSKEDADKCEGLVTVNECMNALKKMKNDSSPGLDGITAAWYKTFWVKIKDILINSLNESFDKGKLSSTQRKGVICLLHKGKDLPREELGNWRPLSLTNVDYKILAKVLAIRFRDVIEKLVNEDQAGFIKNRNASFILRAIDDVIEYTDSNKIPGILIALDYSKAFDNISKEFMMESFKIFGFGNNFVQWINVLNTDTSSCMNYCGWLSEYFNIECGIRQGCPISPMCFVLACELLSCKIRQSDQIKGINLILGSDIKEIKIQQYADDTTLFVSDELSLCNALDMVEEFSQISGLKINKAKTEAMWIGSCKERLDNIDIISWKLGGDYVKILGVKFNGFKSASAIDENWESRLQKCENIMKSWSQRGLDVSGKIVLVKSLLSSQFIYIMQAFICPDWFLTKLNTLLFKFIWSKRDVWHERKKKVIEKVKRKVIITDCQSGGLNMIDMKHMQVSLILKWVTRIISDGNGSWRSIPSYYFNTLGRDMSVFNSNTAFKSFKGLTSKFPTFYLKLLEIWLDTKPKLVELNKTGIIWNNDLFKYKGSIIFIRKWVNIGIVYMSDLLDVKGNVMTYQDLCTKYKEAKLSQLEYNVVYNAVRNKILLETDKKDYTRNIYFGDKIVNDLKAKDIRKHIIKKEVPETKQLVNQKWVKKYGEIAVNEQTWLAANNCTSEARLRLLHWKILHNIYPTKILLKKMNIVDSEYCTRCNVIEDTEHFFYNCKEVKELWKIVENDIKRELTEQECILGINCKQVNILILIAKLCISKYKYGDYANLSILYEREKKLRI